MSTLRILYLAPDDEPDLPDLPRKLATVHRCADLADLLGRALAGSAEVAILSPRAAGIDAVALSRLRAAGTRVVGLEGASDHWRRWGVPAVSRRSADLIAAVRAPEPVDLPDAEPPPKQPDGRVVCVWGPPGAPGRTTVAGLLAEVRARQESVLLIDADLTGGQWAMISNQPVVQSGLIMASRKAATGSLQPADLQELAMAHRGFSVLSGIGDPARWSEVEPTSFQAVLAAAQHVFDLVVVDIAADVRLPHAALAAHWAHDVAAVGRATLEAADLIVAVMRADPMGVQRFASWWPVLEGDPAQTLIVATGCARVPAELTEVLEALGWDEQAVAVHTEGIELSLAVGKKLGQPAHLRTAPRTKKLLRWWTPKMVRGSLKYGNQGASRV